MTNYTKTTDFAAKDSLPSGDSNKVIRGAEFETEFDNIATAISSKADSGNIATTANLVTYTPDGGNAVATTVEAKLRESISVKDFGATGDGTTDDTTAIQKAINHASTRGIQTILFPEGHYKYTTLRFYHHQIDNPAFQGTNVYVGDGLDQTFDFGWYIADASDLTVTVEGVEKTLGDVGVGDYTVTGVGSETGGTVTFNAAPPVPGNSTILRDGDGETLEFFYSGTVVPNASNLSVTVGGVTSTDYTVDIGKKLVVFNAGFAPPVGTDNVVITIQKTINITSDNRDGRFQLRGTGRLAIADLAGLDKNRTRIYGSVLETTGDGIIIDTDQEFGTPVDARNWVAKDLTFIGDNTSYLIKAEKSVGMSLDTCSFKQFNPNGGGIQPRNCWFFTLNQCYVVGQRHIDEQTAAGGIETFTYTFNSPAATSDILVQNRGKALTETTDYTVNLVTQQVTLTESAAVSGDTISISRINTGDGISSQFFGRTFGSFAGLWTISQSLVDSFANGVHWTNGTVTNFSIRDSAIQNCRNYNIYADNGVIQQMLLDNVYFENQKVQGINFLKGNGSGSSLAVIRNLRMTNNFMLGGGTHPRVTGSCIDLDSVDAVNIEGMYVFRMRQPFLNITATKNLQNVPGEIKNSIFSTDQDLSAEPTIYLLSGKIPNVHNCVWPGFSDGFYDTTNDILLFDPSVESNFPRQFTDIKGTTGTAKFGFGDTKVVTVPEGSDTFAPATPEDEFTYTFDSPDSKDRIKVERKPSGGEFDETFDFTVNLTTKLVTLGTVTAAGEEVKISTGSPYNITGSNSRTYYDLTHSIAAGLKVILPDTNEVNDGRLIIIKNNEATTSTAQFPYINVVNNSDQNTTIARLSPGQAGLFVLDKQNSTNFKYVGRTFTDDLELTDDHKITFGRGTGAGPDMEIYHDNTSGESRIDTLAGLTLNGLTYPIADGTSGQSIITDGAGNLTFGTAAGTGITAVVQDTMPQLGGNLDLNGNDITGTGNLDFTGTVTANDLTLSDTQPVLKLEDSDGTNQTLEVTTSAGSSFLTARNGSLNGTINLRRSDGIATTRTMQVQSSGDIAIYADDGTTKAFYWDASTSRLGLGTETPAYQLDVLGSSAAVRIDNDAGSPDQTLMLFQADMGVNDRNFQIKSPTTDSASAPFRFTTGNSFAFEIDTNTSVLALAENGNVGISDEDPIDRLTVSRLGATWTGVTPNANTTALLHPGTTSATSGSALTIAANASSSSTLYFSSSTDNDIGFVSYAHTDNSMQFRVNNSERMRIDSSGNVGIGTDTPSNDLHVNSAGNTVAKISSTFSGSTTTGLYIDTVGDTSAARLLFSKSGVTRGIIGYSHDATATSEAITFSTAGGSEKMRIDGSGKVGIGELAPDEALVVRGGNFSSNQDGGIAIQSGDASGSHLKAAFKLKSDGGGVFRTVIESSSGIAGGTLEAISIANNTGFVGIGTGATVPARELEIASSAPEIRLSDTDGTNQYCELAMNAGVCTITARNDTDDGAILFRGAGGGVSTEYGKWDQSGRFRIGNWDTAQGDLDVGGVFTVDIATEDAIITGATPGLEFIENDNGGSKMRMAWNNTTLFQSLYGDTTTTFGSINIQTRASDGSGNQVVYAYDPINDRNWWGTRAAGSVAMQLQSNGNFNVRGGDVIFENSSQVDKFVWDASASALGVGITTPARTLHISDVMRLEPSATPSSPSAGDVYYDSTTNKLRCYNGTIWNDLF